MARAQGMVFAVDMRRFDGNFFWPPFLLLTVSLLLLVRLPPWGYQPVQSLHIFSNLPLFVALYVVWLSLLLFRLWRVRSSPQAALLVGSFVLVHVGTVVLANAYAGGEDWLKAADAVQIQQSGDLSFEGYTDFPALAILGAFLATVTDTEIITLRTPLLLIWLVLLSTLLLVAYSRLFKSLPLAALTVLLAVQSNLMLSRFHLYPSIMGLLLVVAILSFLLGRQGPLTARERMVLIILMAGLTMTHFVSSLVGLAIITGYYLERLWRGRPEVVSRQAVTLGLILVTTWAVYWTAQTFPQLVGLLPEIDDRFRQGIAFFYVARVAGANTASLPFWVTAVQTFWWLAVYLVGGVLALRSLLLQRRLSGAAHGYAGAYVLVAAALTVGTVVSLGGNEFYRLIIYGSFLAAPLVVHFLFTRRKVRILALAVSGLFLALSFPTLLAHNTSIGQRATQVSEVAGAQFLSTEVEGREKETRLFGGHYGPDRVNYYAPGLIPGTVPFPKQAADIMDVEEGRALWASYVRTFLDEANQGQEAVFFFDYQDVIFWRHIFQMPEDDPQWRQVAEDLSEAVLFYDAGPVQIYRSITSSESVSVQEMTP